jgi:FkbM family methyltransferase
MDIRHGIRKILWRLGYDVSKFAPASHPLARRKQLMRTYGIDTVLDIGANSGQFARQLRNDLGYRGKIVSFEPVKSAYSELERSARDDEKWQVFNYGLGDVEQRCEINVAGNSQSSSILDMLPLHLDSAPQSRYMGKEVIEVRTLDSVFDSLGLESNHIYMKVDTQGYEQRVLQGAQGVLPRIGTIQVEMSLAPLYAGELPFNELCPLLIGQGYTLVAIENGFADPDSGRLLQADGIFHRFAGAGLARGPTASP